ncbi:3-deoxy-D-manno-octulosonic acid transferase [Mesosutterella sp. AGMB02718]|uniref:3-deoxy-D-manno-octulosonic acid transferase n=1 Tax=Mesosutterella faecium TaxID=2925194 RepID=A0ABT7IM35_9BURK|nr:3-deoxy-D-manno-octulosonic acid transferase [Mesosutterella sp. AGMB02718]MDL2058983.1 3-deoxy-D-manno-octulosonic acid transferase [Mesosutterella sp. AGMB02718]
MNIGLNGYRVLTRLAVPAAMGYLLFRSRRQPAYRNYWGERFGLSQYPAPRGCPRVWIHAVSVGETNAARPLVASILKQWPECDILLTHMTPTGREAGHRIVNTAPDRICQCYLPYDTPEAMSAFFRETEPSLGIVMETEIWPNMLAEAQRWGVPMALVNARESMKSLRQALRVPRLMGEAVRRFSVILAQSEQDAANLQRLGAERIAVAGSLKFDIRPDPAQVEKAKRWKAAIRRPGVMLASTREGEEAAFLEAYPRYREAFRKHRALLILVPRHPQRFSAVKKLLELSGIRVQARSALHSPEDLGADTEVLLGDSMGEMSFYCGLADEAIMGGSFLDFGCQNLIEPCAQSVPVILGPSVFNFSEAASNALAMHAACQVKNCGEAFAEALSWLDQPQLLADLSANSLKFASRYVGATRVTMGYLDKLWKKEPLGEFQTY